MLTSLARRLFGSANEKLLRKYSARLPGIAALGPELEKLDDDGLRERLSSGPRTMHDNGAPPDALLPEVFAIVREAARRTLGLRHYDVQLIGGMVLHDGRIAEMKTGEGKTLVATLPACLNAIGGRGVHIVTVNDYLGKRDAAWMGQIYGFLGFSTGCIVNSMDDAARRAAYAADITYATNNELGFDYLRDNMKYRREDMVQRPFHYGIVDEVDSILIDEARTPLIISGAADDSSGLYREVDGLMAQLEPDDYEKEEKHRNIVFTEKGIEKMEALLAGCGLLKGKELYAPENMILLHHLNQALRAHRLFARDVDYIVNRNRVVIIDEFTGRMMEGRRYSEGLHQALEAKEGVDIQPENQTLASITFQNFFRLYPRLAGMTGTAVTEAAEFSDIYRLDVVAIPPNVPVRRKDHEDEIYRTGREKLDALVARVAGCHREGQPVLVGTVSIEKSEKLSALLKERHIPHTILNARYHEQEAEIIAQAGRHGAVTLATNMAGRGTDIQLGGNPEMQILQEVPGDLPEEVRAARIRGIHDRIREEREKVIAAGGLLVIGSERHESRRIDNQLRGRSGRQGDPGASQFFLSLEDDLMRIFGSERIDGMLRRLGIQEGEAITHVWVSRALERAQKKVEERNFEIRRNLLRYDDVMNEQRRLIYEQRLELIDSGNIREMLDDMRHDCIHAIVRRHMPGEGQPGPRDMAGLSREVSRLLDLDFAVDPDDPASGEDARAEQVAGQLDRQCDAVIDALAGELGEEQLLQAGRSILLQRLDHGWKEHLLHLDHLRQGIGLRAYAQRDPLNEYRQEAYGMFEVMLENLRESVTMDMMHLPALVARQRELAQEQQRLAGEAWRQHQERSELARPAPRPPPRNDVPGRNDPCPCGSGKKYKRCHGRLA